VRPNPRHPRRPNPGIIKSITFGSYGNTLDVFKQRRTAAGTWDGVHTMFELFVGGCIGGLACTVQHSQNNCKQQKHKRTSRSLAAPLYAQAPTPQIGIFPYNVPFWFFVFNALRAPPPTPFKSTPFCAALRW
jgi:hypothetical protein